MMCCCFCWNITLFETAKTIDKQLNSCRWCVKTPDFSTQVSFNKRFISEDFMGWDFRGRISAIPQVGVDRVDESFIIQSYAELISPLISDLSPGPQTQDFHPDSTRSTFLGAVHVWSQSLWSHRWWATRQFGGLQLGYTKLQSPGAGFWKSPSFRECKSWNNMGGWE